jgi:hypothetical protein
MDASEVGSGAPPRLEAVERELRAPWAAGVAGLVFATLFSVSMVLFYRHPAAGSSAAEIAAWYLRDRGTAIGFVGVYLMPFAGIAFLWFVATVRDRIGAREDKFFATVFLGGGILFVAMLYAAAAAISAPLAAVKFQHAPPPSPDVFVFARGLGYTLLFVFGLRAAAVFMIVSSTIALRTGALPRWIAYLGFAVALVLLFSVSYVRAIVFAFPAWVALVSILALRRARSERRQSPAHAA